MDFCRLPTRCHLPTPLIGGWLATNWQLGNQLPKWLWQPIGNHWQPLIILLIMLKKIITMFWLRIWQPLKSRCHCMVILARPKKADIGQIDPRFCNNTRAFLALNGGCQNGFGNQLATNWQPAICLGNVHIAVITVDQIFRFQALA